MRPFPPYLTRALARGGSGLTIVVVRLGAMGDILRTLPPVRLLRRGLPEARIHWVVEEKWSPVLEGCPELNGRVEMPRKAWRRLAASPGGWPRLARSVAEFRRHLRRLGAGLVLDFHGNLRSGITGRFSGAPVRLGYSGHQQKEGNRWLNTHHWPSGSRRTPRMERNLDLIRALNLPDGPHPATPLPLARAGRAAAARILGPDVGGGGRAVAVLSPGASAAQAYKRPPAELLAAAGRRLARDGIDSLVVWGPGEQADAARVVAALGGGARLAPPTDLAALAAILERARIFVGGDSGPLHLACAVGCPVLGIYGPTDPEVNRPWGVPAVAVAPRGRRYTGVKRTDRAAGGFEGLEAGQIESALDELLAPDRRPQPRR